MAEPSLDTHDEVVNVEEDDDDEVCAIEAESEEDEMCSPCVNEGGSQFVDQERDGGRGRGNSREEEEAKGRKREPLRLSTMAHS